MSRAGDLIVLTADKDQELTFRSLLRRHEDLGTRPFTFEVIVDREGKDPGVYRRAHDLLRPYAARVDRCLAVFDRHGCGAEHLPSTTLEQNVESKLSRNGWSSRRCAAIAIDPELEAWVWYDTSTLLHELGLSRENLRRLLKQLPDRARNPKQAFRYCLRQVGRPPSSATFSRLAASAKFDRCRDRSFRKLRSTLQKWFPPG